MNNQMGDQTKPIRKLNKTALLEVCRSRDVIDLNTKDNNTLIT